MTPSEYAEYYADMGFGLGWVPYEFRTKEAQKLTDEVNERIGTFGEVGSTVDVPNEVIFPQLEKEIHGSLLPRVQQITGSCLPPDAKVLMGDGTEKNISEVKAGDEVQSHRGLKRKVTQVFERDSEKNLITLKGESTDRVLQVTADHVVGTLQHSSCKCSTNVRWKYADKIIDDDVLLLRNANGTHSTKFGNPVGVAQTEEGAAPEGKVWDINVEHDHSFVANGYVVHNCVGAGAATSYVKAMLGDVYYRGDNEEVKPIFPWATYGVGRKLGGMRRAGEGSFGDAQAEASDPKNFGYIPWDHPLVPKPVVNGQWWKYSRAIELEWSHPSSWKVDYKVMREVAGQHGIHKITRIRSIEEWVQALAQGYQVTLASMFGTRNAKLEQDLLVGHWNTRWAHQMSSCSYILDVPRLGTCFQTDNQWGRFHPTHLCKVLGPLGVEGSFWMPERDAEKVIRTGEVIAHSSTGNFGPRRGMWDVFKFGVA